MAGQSQPLAVRGAGIPWSFHPSTLPRVSQAKNSCASALYHAGTKVAQSRDREAAHAAVSRTTPWPTQSAQFSTCRPGTWRKCFRLRVTNVARLVEADVCPHQLSIMGGVLTPLRHRGAVRDLEHNFSRDPVAAATVLSTHDAVLLVPLDVTAHLRLGHDPALAFLRQLPTSGTTIVRVSARDEARGRQIIFQYGDKDFSGMNRDAGKNLDELAQASRGFVQEIHPLTPAPEGWRRWWVAAAAAPVGLGAIALVVRRRRNLARS